MNYKVSKGLETDFLLYGCTVKNFYLLMSVGVGCILLLAMDIMNTLKKGDFSGFFLHLFFLVMVFISAWFILSRMSKKAKYKFGRGKSTITNRDILNYL